MFDNLIPERVRNFIDSIFSAPMSFLDMIKDMFSDMSLVAGKGITLSNYFVFMNYLPYSFQLVIQSLLLSFLFLTTIYIIKATWNVYLNVKQSLKWW